MKQFVLLLALVVVVSADSFCVPKPVSDYEPIAPPSVTRVTSAASEIDPSLSSDIRIIAGIAESSPTFAPVESVIESYERSHSGTVSLLEYYDLSPSDVISPTTEAEIESDFPTLASAVDELVSEEESHASLYDIQDSFEDLMVYYPSIVTVGETSFEFSYASLIPAESGISKAAVSSPSIVTDVEILTSMVSLSPSLSTYVSELEIAAEYYSTALHEITTARDWTETDAWYVDSSLVSIETCYPTLYSALVAIDTFLSSHSSDSSAFSHLVTALTYVPSIISDVTEFVTAVSPSFTEALVSLSPAVQIDSHITTEVTYLDVLEASSPSLSCAEGTLERDLVSQAATVSEIEQAITSPSAVTNPTYISSLEARYPSIASAEYIIQSIELTHPSLVYVQSEVNYDEEVVSDLLTAANELISETSPSLIGDAYDLQKVEYVEPSITSALHSLSTIIEASPQLSCAESVIAKYAATEASVLYTIARALSSPSDIAASSIAYIAKLTAEYPSLASALRTVESVEYTFPQLTTIEQALTFALTYEPSLISVYKQVTEYDSIVSGEVCSFAPSFSS
jgi:hypothetical protein